MLLMLLEGFGKFLERFLGIYWGGFLDDLGRFLDSFQDMEEIKPIEKTNKQLVEQKTYQNSLLAKLFSGPVVASSSCQ